jgi:hypothetical protein
LQIRDLGEVRVFNHSLAAEMLDEGDTPASQMWELPCQDFEGYWESYVIFKDKKYNKNII